MGAHLITFEQKTKWVGGVCHERVPACMIHKLVFGMVFVKLEECIK